MFGRSLITSILAATSAFLPSGVGAQASSSTAVANAQPPYPFTLPISPFKVNIPASAITEMHTLVRLSKLPPTTYESTNRSLGINGEWVKQAKATWENPLKFSWRAFESEINQKLPQYIAKVPGENGEVFDIHFAAVWNENKDAVPIVIMHGWPGAFTETIPTVELLRQSTNPPFHIIIPSPIGYHFSSRPPTTRDFTLSENAALINKLLVGLGFGTRGYIVQAGDVGHWIARMLTHYDACKGILLNFFIPGNLSEPTPLGDLSELTPAELAGLQRAAKFSATGSGYAIEQATRPSTIGHAVASSPLALLAWIGEKYLDGMQVPLTLEGVLRFVSLYWLTETYPTSIWMYRQLFIGQNHGDLWQQMQIKKPFGIQQFPGEILLYPKKWTEQYGDLVYFKTHTKGGHWPSVEVPDLMAEDIAEFANVIFNGNGTTSSAKL